MAAYAIVDLHILDVEAYLEYQHAVRPLLREVGARYLARGGEFEVLEGDMQPERLLLMEFSSLEALRNFYSSAPYQALEAQKTPVAAAVAPLLSRGWTCQPIPGH